MTLTAGSLSLSPGLTGSYPAVAADGNGFPGATADFRVLVPQAGPAGGRQAAAPNHTDNMFMVTLKTEDAEFFQHLPF